MAKKQASTKGKTAKKASPRQKALPGMEDRALAALEAKAEEYADIRDERMQLTEQESELNDELLALMKKHKKAEYHHGEVHCWVKATDEKVKVKIGEITPKQKKAESADVSTAAKLNSEEPKSSEDGTEPEQSNDVESAPAPEPAEEVVH